MTPVNPEEEHVLIELVGQQFSWGARYAGKDGKLGRANVNYIEGTNFTTFEVAFHYQYWRLRPANDSGLVDSTTTEESIIRSTYSGYHSTIIETDTSCDNIPSF